jgi:hypothetical protein
MEYNEDVGLVGGFIMSEQHDGLALPGPDHPAWGIVDCFPPTEWGEQAWAAFQRDYGPFLQEFRGQWAAYHGELRVGIAAELLPLYDECLRRGLPLEECVICRIQPILADEFIGLGMSHIEYVN